MYITVFAHFWGEDNCFAIYALKYLFIYLFIYLLLERGEGRKRGRGTSMCEIHWLPLTHPQMVTRPATQACALTGNRTCDISVCRLMLNPLSHSSQGSQSTFY